MQLLKNSETDEDRRTNAELAVAFGLSEATLMSLSNIDPQKTSLRVFNALFPTNKAKDDLKNVAHVITEYPNLLNDIYGKLRCADFFFFNKKKEKKNYKL